MVYKLVLGDWSKDGHKQSEDFLFDCNYDVHKIRQAYKDSCKKLGVAFHDEDYENCTNLCLMITVMFGQIMRPHILMKQILKF